MDLVIGIENNKIIRILGQSRRMYKARIDFNDITIRSVSTPQLGTGSNTFYLRGDNISNNYRPIIDENTEDSKDELILFTKSLLALIHTEYNVAINISNKYEKRIELVYEHAGMLGRLLEDDYISVEKIANVFCSERKICKL